MPKRNTGLTVLQRAICALEAVAANPGSTTGVIAAKTGLPASSVSRILATWRERGYVDQDGSRGTWTLGPRCLALSASSREGILVRNIEPILRRLHERNGYGITLAVRRGIHRISLIQFGPDGSSKDVFQKNLDLVTTATGRLLLSMAPSQQRRRLCQQLGLPASSWPQAVTDRELVDILNEIALKGHCEVRTASWWAAAIMIQSPNDEHLAVGVYLPRSRETEGPSAYSALRKTVKLIQKSLS